MQRTASASRWPLLITVAIIAAAAGDPLVESIANTGVAGSGYADNDHASVVPALVLGAVFAAVLLAVRCVRILRHAGPFRPGRAISAAHDFPLVFFMQLTAVFLMENAEQVGAGEPLEFGTSWLGGPAWLSLVVHLATGACMFAVLARAMRALTAWFAAVVHTARRFVWLVQGARRTCRRPVRDRELPLHAELRLVRLLADRSPPPLLRLPI